MLKKIIGATLFILVIFIFCYFRLKPLYFQTVGYTYDQGRDFLKAAEIIQDKNITFIGPTTGVQGLFHGAWYYYLLVIPFILFNGLPIGFYYFNFTLHLLSLLLLMFFLYKNFGTAISLLIGLLIAASPYFIFTSLFVGNNIFVLPVLVLLIILTFRLMQAKKGEQKYMWLTVGIFLSLIFEFEVAFGLFLIPGFLIAILLQSNLRKDLFRKINWLFLLSGALFPLIPRFLFEAKNGFFQTKTLLSFFFKPKLHNPKSILDVVNDRFNLFIDYANNIFTEKLIFNFFLLLLGFSLIIIFINRKKVNLSALTFFSKVVILLFAFTLFYKDNFWSNYYEGIQYIYLFISAIILHTAARRNKLILIPIYFILILTVANSFKTIAEDWNHQPKDTLLKNQINITNYIAGIQIKERKSDYCVKIYTPPVIPFTYRYLFKHINLSRKLPEPKDEWVEKKCWYIIESDDNNERRDEWVEKNIPRVAKQSSRKIFDNVEVRHYEIK